MVYIKKFESFQSDSILVIVDVQKSFRKYFSEMYLNELKKYCNTFQFVYQIFDNHVDGKNVDKDYLYDDKPELIELFNQLHEAFSIIKLKINLFSIKKDKKHADDSIHHFNSVLGVFQNMKAMTQEYLKTDSKAPQTEPRNTA